MKKEDLALDQEVHAFVKEDLKHPFSGVIEKIYENSVLLQITANDPEDDTAVSDLNRKIVVSINSLS